MIPGTGKGVSGFKANWFLEEFEGSPERTLATYTLLFEPDRNYPRWIMNFGLKRTLGKVIRAVRKRIKKLNKTAKKQAKEDHLLHGPPQPNVQP